MITLRIEFFDDYCVVRYGDSKSFVNKEIGEAILRLQNENRSLKIKLEEAGL